MLKQIRKQKMTSDRGRRGLLARLWRRRRLAVQELGHYTAHVVAYAIHLQICVGG